eukprot:6218623-Prorocentrum_lima.AAC.1
MTSSLVGSEMCIRDRKRSERRGSCRGDVGVKMFPDGQLVTTRCSGNIGTVSYTHLTLPTICSV